MSRVPEAGTGPGRAWSSRAALAGVFLAASALSGAARARALPAQQEVQGRMVPGPVGFERILWMHGGPARDAALFEAVRGLGFSAVSVSIGEDPALPGEHGLRFYRDQLAGKGVLELRDRQWLPALEAYAQDRHPRALLRPACLSNPATAVELEDAVAKALRQALPHDPLAASLADEASTTRHANPLDFCFSDDCLRAYRSMLKRVYGDVHALNQRWRSQYPSLDDVEPWTADRIRAREVGGAQIPAGLQPWALHLEFRDELFARTVQSCLAVVRAAAPRVPCGLTGIQPPSAYGGHDYRRLLPLMSFYEVYDIGGARDLAMCLAPVDAVQTATLFPPGEDQPSELARARVFDFLAHGMGGVIVWSAGGVLDDAGVPTSFGRAVAAAFALARPALVAFGGARVVRSPVWLVESQASVRAHWMLDSAGDGDTWIRRLSSYEAAHSTSQNARRGWVRLLEDLGLQGRFVPAEWLPAALAAGGPRILVLPACLALSDDAVRAIRGYVAAGGVLLADHGAALYDEHLRRREQAALDDVFGVRGRSLAIADQLVRQGRGSDRARLPSGAAVAERGLRGRVAEPAGDHHVQIESAFGRGKARYLNLAVCEYAELRLDPGRHRTALDLRARVRRVLLEAGVDPPVAVRGEGLPTCVERIELRARDGRRLLAVRLNALDDIPLMRALGERGVRPIELIFPAPVRLLDLCDPAAAELGSGVRFVLPLDPFGALLLEVRPAG